MQVTRAVDWAGTGRIGIDSVSASRGRHSSCPTLAFVIESGQKGKGAVLPRRQSGADAPDAPRATYLQRALRVAARRSRAGDVAHARP